MKVWTSKRFTLWSSRSLPAAPALPRESWRTPRPTPFPQKPSSMCRTFGRLSRSKNKPTRTVAHRRRRELNGSKSSKDQRRSSSPHHTRPNLPRGSVSIRRWRRDRGTREDVEQAAGVTVVYTTFASPSDPNFYDDNEFKAAVDTLISSKRPIFFLDLHGSNAYRPYDVDLGTMNGQSLLGQDALALDIVEALRSEGLTNISYNYFPAAANQTLTKFASARGVRRFSLRSTVPGWRLPKAILPGTALPSCCKRW